MTKLITSEFFIKLTHFFIKSAKIGNDFLRPLEELQDLQDSLLWSYLPVFFMSLFFLDFTVSLSSSNHFVFLLLVVEVVVVVVVEATLGITRSRRGGD